MSASLAAAVVFPDPCRPTRRMTGRRPPGEREPRVAPAHDPRQLLVRSVHRRVLRDAFDRHGGHEIATAGDGFFVVFERAGEAVAAAVDAQRALHESQQEEDASFRVRISLRDLGERVLPHLEHPVRVFEVQT